MARAPLFTTISMPRARSNSNLKVSNENREWQAENHYEAEQMKAVHRREHRCLLRHNARSEALCLMNRVGAAGASCHQVLACIVYELLD